MGTRADFYVGVGPDAEWLGSVAWDGYEWADKENEGDESDKADGFKATTVDEFRKEVAAALAGRDDATYPTQGWPWPWNTSDTTDYVYWFADGGAHFATFDEEHEWPDMTKFQSVQFGKRSGLIVISG